MEKPGLGSSKDLVQIVPMCFPYYALGQLSPHPRSSPTSSVRRADDAFLTTYPKDQLNDAKTPGRILGYLDYQSDGTPRELVIYTFAAHV